MTLLTALAVGIAGGAGAVARFVVDGAVRSRMRTAIPVGTMLVNVLGSLLIGVLAGLGSTGWVPSEASVVAGIGFLGGFTTFSTASVETVRLIQSGRPGRGAVNALATAALCLAAAAAGLVAGSSF